MWRGRGHLLLVGMEEGGVQRGGGGGGGGEGSTGRDVGMEALMWRSEWHPLVAL